MISKSFFGVWSFVGCGAQPDMVFSLLFLVSFLCCCSDVFCSDLPALKKMLESRNAFASIYFNQTKYKIIFPDEDAEREILFLAHLLHPVQRKQTKEEKKNSFRRTVHIEPLSLPFLFVFSLNPVQKKKMASLGADVQTTSNELVILIEDMKERRADLDRVIKREEEEKLRLLGELKALTDRLNAVEDSLNRKLHTRQEFDRTIAETSAAFSNILDSSRKLLSTLKQDTLSLTTGSSIRKS